MEALSVGLLPRSAHETRPANQSRLPIARCRGFTLPDGKQSRSHPRLPDSRNSESADQPSCLGSCRHGRDRRTSRFVPPGFRNARQPDGVPCQRLADDFRVKTALISCLKSERSSVISPMTYKQSAPPFRLLLRRTRLMCRSKSPFWSSSAKTYCSKTGTVQE